MKFIAFVESDSFQIGLLADGPIPQWTEEALDGGIADIENGLLVATYPDLDHRKLSIPVTVMDKEEMLAQEQKETHQLLGVYEIQTRRGFIDVGCIPSICEGTSGRLRLNKDRLKLAIYGDLPREPHKLIIHFMDASIISVDAHRLNP